MSNNFEYSLVLACAGKSERYKKEKLLEIIGNKFIFEHSYLPFLNDTECKEIILVIPDRWHTGIIVNLIKQRNNIRYVYGGKERFYSIKNGIQEVKTKYTIIHDGVRPLIKSHFIEKLKSTYIKEKQKNHKITGATTYQRINSLVVNESNKEVKNLRIIETPQLYETKILKRAYQNAEKDDYRDTSTIFIDQQFELTYVLNEEPNFKITFKKDLENYTNLLLRDS